jgi:hypothetical protein
MIDMMTLVTDIIARAGPAENADLALCNHHIARATMWVCMLDALSDIATRFGEYLTQKASPETRVPKGPMMVCRLIGDPIRAFARVMRALQLAISLATKIEDDIAGLKAGILPSWAAPSAKAPCPQTARSKTTPMGELTEEVAEGTRLGDADQEADLEVLEIRERAEALRGELPERLRDERESARFYRLLNGPLKDAVAAICADLGLKPDWSLWTEDGFPPPGGRREDWIRFFVPEGDVAPRPSPGRTAPFGPPRERVRDPLHLLDTPTRCLHEFLSAAGIEPRPPPSGARRTFGAYPPIPLTS